ncbi:MAG: hypothetical protein ACOC11_00510, partial [Prolixibacteraceae bacterium]
QPVFGSPAGRFGLQPGCLIAFGRLVVSCVSFVPHSHIFRKPISFFNFSLATPSLHSQTARKLEPGPQPIPQSSIHCSRVQPFFLNKKLRIQ